MTAVIVDTNVLLDLLTQDPRWSSWSAEAIERAADTSTLIINEIIYAELSIGYPRVEDLDAALPQDMFRREHVPFQAAFLAGKAFLDYRRRGGMKAAPLPDFFNGAHASVAGYRLLTRDAARYRSYFPGVSLIAPP